MNESDADIAGLKTETNTPEMEAKIRRVFEASEHAAEEEESYQYDFEHGQWWVTELGTGRQWSVCDADPGDFDFELVSDGADR